ncbi:MAG: 50S ribosomal protein L3 [Candidatus Raymondbacteria bacterium RifOxyA12_full_50_37]|uniref:Large ribosomal subunit protein uL3 n=1 Tax=Candidatus Raymondbacteria bacterium RIFOXYD12_FULL_49_13 TaxID=1817890 RepID=A0A1F7FDR4_UNCRA|nr:ribosomal protein L3 [uncultured bacterium]OGJ88077.1 MAG: 50S ribosomal protein L3 [Candidatus Raymondbacteria bacterium RifOxyA12_full_50_37]OGJ94054.1 MAG: 50S ribosomal protein L3 [Candidatus Raymondbacteria bacterium RIFOXYA2_FULL_49_16]OGJ96879.1 MAG: 50S ribosomal protein L3 [Candidatus Raymondbacteria bacterium RIFOXYC2_FULL_50_21]OGJ97498.1 MAG: 50S ribosomal protein L3 [Candidatus Raymondbacteria bacterium RifOxyC12_full_50_8]OGK00948.1 MAG: 50S ribosomal protein L3 [Candidatus Ra
MLNKVFAKKIGMTSVFNSEGQRLGVTVLQAFPLKILQIKTKEHDGYNALVVGFNRCREKSIRAPQRGLLKKAGSDPVRCIAETTADDFSKYSVGQEVGLDAFTGVSKVDISGTSKGRGFAGGIKRHHFHRGRETHGNKMHREGGSIGQHTDPSNVWKGKRMAGRMGGKPATVRNVEIFSIDTEKNIIIIEGAVPGANSGVINITRAYGRK